MKEIIKPLTNHIVGRKEKKESKTSSGILLTATAVPPPERVEIIAIGPDVKNLKIGQKIIYKAHLSMIMKHEGDDVVVMPEDAVTATFEGAP
jgi:chaperonin GroES